MTKPDLNAEFNAMRPSDMVQLITRCMEVRRPCMIWGPPGIGKSDIIAQIGEAQNRPVIDMRLLLMEPTDIKGIPYYNPESKEMRWAAPSELPKEGSGMENAILFLDEINAAAQSVQAAAYQLILNRRVGEYKLPDGVSIVAAGNRETDKAVTFRMPSALANRFVHFEMRENFDDWQDWAIKHRVSADVLGFLTAFPNYLFDFNPRTSGKAFATPRSWTFTGELLDDNLSDSLNQAMVAGTVGLGLAGEFMQHRRLKGKLPDPRDILEGKVTKLKNDKEVDVSAKYSLVIGLCYALEQMHLSFMMAEGHFTKEMVIMGAVVALRKYAIEFNSETSVFTKFYKNYQKWIVSTG